MTPGHGPDLERPDPDGPDPERPDTEAGESTPDRGSEGSASAEPESARERAEHRRRRARVFGEVLPEATSDERGDAWGDRESSADEWLRRQVPPHHG